jgi:hypothetical protein
MSALKKLKNLISVLEIINKLTSEITHLFSQNQFHNFVETDIFSTQWHLPHRVGKFVISKSG